MFIYLYVYTGCYRVTFVDVDCNDIIVILIKSDKIVTRYNGTCLCISQSWVNVG